MEEHKEWYQVASNIRSFITIICTCIAIGVTWGNLSSKMDVLEKSLNSFQAQVVDLSKSETSLELAEKLLEQRVLSLETNQVKSPSKHQ